VIIANVCKNSGMANPTTPAEAIEQNALGPKSVSVGNQSVTQNSIPEQIAADRYLASREAATNKVKGFGLRFQKIVPPGGG
jgi:hypothetical protein